MSKERVKITQMRFDALCITMAQITSLKGKDHAQTELSKIVERIELSEDEVDFLKSIIHGKAMQEYGKETVS